VVAGPAGPCRSIPRCVPIRKTIRGATNIGATAPAAGALANTSISFIYAFATTPTVKIVLQGAAAPAECTGTRRSRRRRRIRLHLRGVEDEVGRVTLNAVNRSGATIFTNSSAAGGFFTFGTWAATGAKTGKHRGANEVTTLVAVTQDELYATLDLDALVVTSRHCPSTCVRSTCIRCTVPREFHPALVEVLRTVFTLGAHVLDPFCGLRTTLVQALESWARRDRRRARGLQLSADRRQDRAVRRRCARSGAARRLLAS